MITNLGSTNPLLSNSWVISLLDIQGLSLCYMSPPINSDSLDPLIIKSSIMETKTFPLNQVHTSQVYIQPHKYQPQNSSTINQ